MNPDATIRHIIIVGGGTAGWLTACHLAKQVNAKNPDAIQISVIESPTIPTIGVGEGTVPAIRKTLRYFGIRETDLIRQCDATFKQSIQFIDWKKNTTTPTKPHTYHHLFDFPCIQPFDVTPYWLLNPRETCFADAVSVQGKIADWGLGPKQMTHAEYEGITQYAYHLDAAKFALLLTQHAVHQLGVKHHLANVKEAIVNTNGFIEKIVTDLGEYSADLFIDCSGFSGLLIGDAMESAFLDKQSSLFCDYALAAQVPYATADAPIPCFTQSTAKDAGWIWDIGLSTRRGTGYVYSSRYTTHEQAETTLRHYLGDSSGDISCKKIPMRVGYRETPWINNCIAIGLSQGFVEPLEATGLLIYDATAKMLADLLPATYAEIPRAAKKFNELSGKAWEKVIDFVKLHYAISDRTDSAFWIDNRDANTMSNQLRENLDAWRTQLPCLYDFPSRMEIFNLENYLYVLYGMEYPTRLNSRSTRYYEPQRAHELIKRLQQEADFAASQLLSHRQLINRIKHYGLQTI